MIKMTLKNLRTLIKETLSEIGAVGPAPSGAVDPGEATLDIDASELHRGFYDYELDLYGGDVGGGEATEEKS